MPPLGTVLLRRVEMSYCPSQDWDRFINEQDDKAAAEIAFYNTYRAEIVQLCAGFLANGKVFGEADMTVNSVVDIASRVMQEILSRGGNEF